MEIIILNTETKKNQLIFPCITILSGFCGIFFETLSNKVFTYFFGVTLISTTLTVTIFFTGLALGSYYFSKLASNSKAPLFHYLSIEGIISFFLLMYPSFYSMGLKTLEFSLDQNYFLYVLVKVVLVGVLLFIPTFFMGGSVPFLYKTISHYYKDDEHIAFYYGLNTFGAAFGVFLSSYFLFPSIGLENSSYLAGILNLLIVFVLYTRWDKSEDKKLNFDFKYSFPKFRNIDNAYYGIAFLSGFFVFSAEIIWFNLLALIIGNSVYAFAIMLTSILVGIALGSFLVLKITIKDKIKSFLWCQILLTVYIFWSLFYWDKLGGVFSIVGLFGPGFFTMEMTRFFVCFSFLFIPSLLVGMSFPLLILIYKKIRKDTATTIGYLYAWNSLGSALGIIVSCFVIINIFGNKMGLNIIGTIPLIISGILLYCEKKNQFSISFVLVSLLLVRFLAVPQWDILNMTGGQNIYFSKGNDKDDKVLFHKESTYSGVITLIDKKGVKTLYTNGKFEGNNSTEVLDQYLFSIIPALFSTRYDKAANLGLGVGGSLGAMTQFPYKKIDVIEISPDIIDISKKHFSDINFNSLNNERVNVILEDGRIHFMKNKNEYDLITMESSSIWFAGSANLYGKEFYKIVHDSLKNGGVFQQWIQLHHITFKDIVRIIKTFKSSFLSPSLWIMGHQAILVAKKGGEVKIDYSKIKTLEKNKKISKLIKKIGYDTLYDVFGHLVLTNENLNELIKDMEANLDETIRTHKDLNPILEFSTPRSNSFKNIYSKNRKTLFEYKWFDLKNIIENIPNKKEYKLILESSYRDTLNSFFKN